MFKINRRALPSLAPLLAVAAFGLGVGASSASAAACTTDVLCGESNLSLRDNSVAPPTGGGYGASAFVVNTAGKLRITDTFAGSSIHWGEIPKGDAFFGIKLTKNPASGNCDTAEGDVNFADIQHATNVEHFPSPVYGNNVAWPLKVNSGQCEERRVTIANVRLYLPEDRQLTITGTITGEWVQPGSCPGGSGGIELAVAQTGLSFSVGTLPEIDNGTTGKNAFLCFVAANNYLYPTTAPTWTPLTGSIWGD